ncbi:hypothetical protein D9M71_756410 [compost metagenome]
MVISESLLPATSKLSSITGCRVKEQIKKLHSDGKLEDNPELRRIGVGLLHADSEFVALKCRFEAGEYGVSY